jgi:hypothetical protein
LLFVIHVLYISSVVTTVEARGLYESIVRVEDMIATALPQLTAFSLEEAVAGAIDIGYMSSNVEHAQELIVRIQNVDMLLHQATEAMNEHALADALNECDDFGYNADNGR